MSTPSGKSLLCPIVIGRTSYLNTLEQELTNAAAGKGRTLLITGEAGIGKSRLLEEAKALATARGFTILQGNCFETDRMIPYAPLLDLLHNFVAPFSDNALQRILRPYAAEFMLLLPELAMLWHDITPPNGGDPEQEKRRLFQTLARFFLDFPLHSLPTPLAIVIEDLHWCDESTLEFLHFFARYFATQSLLLLLTFRDDEATVALNRFLAGVDRARIAMELQLTRLHRADTETMIRSIFEQSIRQEFVDKIYDLTDGNPFFIEETLKTLVESGDIYFSGGQWTRKEIWQLQAPRTIQVAVAQRVAQLGNESRRVLTLAAVAGRRFDFSLLKRITSLSEIELIASVKELMRTQLVIEESAESFAFRHALTQQAIYSELLQRERKALHQVIAESIELLNRYTIEPKLAELSFHYWRAEVADKCYYYGRRAGERAHSLHAPRAAVEHYTRALDATRLVADTAPIASEQEIGALLRMRGQAYEQLGEFELARDDLETLLTAAQAHPEQRALWQALMDLGMLWAQRDFARAGDYFQQALEVVREMGDAEMLAHTLKRLGNWHMNVEHVQEAVQHLNEALDLFVQLSDKQGMAETLDLLGIAHFSSSNAIEGAACYERAIALFRQLGNREGELAALLVFAPRHSVYINNAATWPAVSFAERVRDGESALRMAREIGALPGVVLGLIWLGNGLGTGGQYGRGLHLTLEGLALAEQIEHRHFIATGNMILGGIYWDMFLLEEAQGHLETALTAARASHSVIWLGCIVGYLASTLVQRGKMSEADRVLKQMWRADLPMVSHGQRQLWCAWIELALARQHAKDALQAVERLIASDLQFGVRGEYAVPRLAYLRAVALTMLGRYAEAESTLTAALPVAQDISPFLWRLHFALGNNFRRQNRRDDADRAYAVARQTLSQLANTIADSAMRSRFIAHTNAQFPAPTEKQAAKQSFAGLTAKERIVAALIAQGLSNKEIAETMVISHRTVETHVSNLLSKLHLSSCAQIALWAVEKGLT